MSKVSLLIPHWYQELCSCVQSAPGEGVRGYSLYPTLGMLSLCLLHIYSICHTYAAYPILHSLSPHCLSSYPHSSIPL